MLDDVVMSKCMICCRCMCYDNNVLLLFTAEKEPLSDDVVGALGTCVVAMAQLCTLWVYHLPLPFLKALAERKELLPKLYVLSPPGVNWVSSNVLCQCVHCNSTR